MKTGLQSLLVALCVLLSALYFIVTSGEGATQESLSVPDALDIVVIESIHGFSPRTPTVMAALNVLELHPEEAVELVAQRTDVKSLTILLVREPGEDLRQFQIMIVLLRRLASRKGDLLLAEWYGEIQGQRLRSPPSLEKRLQPYAQLVLSSLGSRYNDQVVRSIIEQLSQMDPQERQVSLNYLVAAGKGRQDIVQALERISKDPQSKLEQDPILKQAIELIRSQ